MYLSKYLILKWWKNIVKTEDSLESNKLESKFDMTKLTLLARYVD